MANPIISNLAGDTVLFVEDGTALLLDAFAQVGVSDPDSPDFNGATLTISIAGALPEDLLSILAIGDITARPVGFPDTRFLVYHGNPTSDDDVIGEVVSDGTNGSNLVIELGPDPGASSPSPITADKIAALIHAIAYRNSNTADPAAHDRTVTYTLTDGDGGSTTATVTIQVQPVNDAPTIEGPLAAALIVDESGIGGAFSGEEFNPVLSADGKFMIFQSDTATLVPGITPGREHIFLKDLTTGAVTLVTTGIAGTEANADSRAGSISADGRYVAFGSAASNLVAGDLNGFQDVFLWDRLTGETRLVTTSAGGAQANASTFVSEDDIKVTADGQFVVFITRASNLVTGDVTNTDDILVKNMVTGEVIRASLNANGEVGVDTDSDGNPTAPFYLTTDISDDGRWVAFDTDADNMVPGYDQGPRNSVSMDVYLKDLQTGTVYFVSESNIHPGAAQEGLDGSRFPHISADGRYVLFDAGPDVQPEPTAVAVVWDRVTGAMREVGTTATGAVANFPVGTATISRSGNFVAFTSRATNLTSDSGQEGIDKVFIKNLVTGEIAYIGPGLHGEYYPWVSDDGRVVLYVAGDDYAPGDSDGADDVYAAFRSDGGGIPVIEDVFSTVTGISLADVDSGAEDVLLTLTVPSGTLAPRLIDPEVSVQVNDGDTLVLRGSVAALNNYIASGGVQFKTALNSTDPVPLTVTIDDFGNTGTDPGHTGTATSEAATAVFTLIVEPVNDAPTITGPSIGPVYVIVTTNSAGVNGSQGHGHSHPEINAEGTFVGFNSEASDLVPGDTNGFEDIFIKNLQTGAIERILGLGGAQANGGGSFDSISGDGRWVLFTSDASNLVVGDTNGFNDVFLHDRQTGLTSRINVAADGTQASDFANGGERVSDNGRWVVFVTSVALVPEDTNNARSLYRKDMLTGAFALVAVTPSGEQGVTDSAGTDIPANYRNSDISEDGRYVVIETEADNLVAGYDQGTRISITRDIFLKDMVTGEITLLSGRPDGTATQTGFHGSFDPRMSADGRYILFSTDTSQQVGESGVILVDRLTGARTLVSTNSAGEPDNGFSEPGFLSRDGRHVVFESTGTNLVSPSVEPTDGEGNIFLKDLLTGETVFIGRGGDGEIPTVSTDGLIVFATSFDDAAGDSDGEGDLYLALLPPPGSGGIPVTENTPSPVKGITFDDVDAGSNPVTVRFTVERGTLSAVPFGNVTVSNATGLSITLDGPFADINAFLAQNRLLYTTAPDDTADVPIVVRINDNGHSGITFGGGGFRAEGSLAQEGSFGLFDEEAFLLTVTPLADPSPGQNDAPVNAVPATREFEANVPAAITGLSVADDSGHGVITTTLSLQFGILTLAASGGAAIDHNGTGKVTLTGTLAQINAALAGSNVIYSAPHDFFGTDTLTMFTNDNGNTGSGGPLTDTDSVTIHLNTYLEGTDGDNSFHALPGNEFIVARPGLDTITFDFALTDATVSYRNNLVIIDGPSSHTVLSGFETYVFTDGTVQNADSDRLVDDLFYYSRYHDVWNAHADADAHYHATGWHEGRDPNAFFDTDLYLALNADIRHAALDPLVHFDQFGWREGRIPSTAFDPEKYLATYSDVAAANRDPLEHFLRHGAEENRLPSAADAPLAANGFDFSYYLLHNPDVAAAGVDPFLHFETSGWREGRNPNALFDVNGYLAHYADVAAAGINPLDHYHQSGWHEGRDPSVDFDSSAYLAAYPDVAAANRDPLAHYLQFGIHEGRSTFADGVWG